MEKGENEILVRTTPGSCTTLIPTTPSFPFHTTKEKNALFKYFNVSLLSKVAYSNPKSTPLMIFNEDEASA